MTSQRLLTLGQLRLDPPATTVLGGRRKELVLLAFLARRAPRAVSREELAALFWEVRDEPRARHSLRQALHRLKRALGEALAVDGSDVRFVEGTVELDATQFEREIAAGNLEAAVSLWRGDFLPAAEDAGGEAYRAWLESEREALRRKLVLALARLSRQAEQRGAWADAVAWAEKWLGVAPLDEAAQTRLAETLRLAGHAVDRRPGAAALFTPDMVGRSAAFGELVTVWHGVEEGAGAVVLIAGEEGIGRTRLVQEFTRWTAGRGASSLLLHAASAEPDADTEWSTARRLFAPLRSAPGLGGAADQALGEVSRFVPSLRDRFANLPAPVGNDDAILRAARDVLRDVGVEVPILLVLDDFSAADAATQRLLLALAADPPPGLLLLFTDRSETFDAASNARLHQLRGLRRIHLQPLTETEVDALVASMLVLDADERHAFARRLREDSGGNPFFAIEQVHALAEEGLLALADDGSWRLAADIAARPLPLPARVREASRSRLLRLDEDSRSVVEAAAVLGAEVAPAWLESMVRLAPSAFSAAIDTLLSRRILRPATAAPDRLEFSHPLMRRLIYEQLSPARLRTLHAAALHALEADPTTREGAQPLLAWHRERAGPARPAPAWLRSRPLAIAALLVVVFTVWAGLRLMTRSATPVSPTTIAVMPFSLQGGGDLAYLREGVPTLLSTGLEGAAGLRIVDPHVLLAAAARESATALGPERGKLLAARFGAGLYVLGTITAAGGRLQVTASLYDADGQLQTTAHATVEGEAETFLLVDQLARQLLASLPQGAGARFAGVAAATTTSLSALKAYLDGERELRVARFAQAANAFGRALDEDSTFALAAYRNAVAAEWLKDPVMEARSIERAMRHRRRLPERDRRLVEAYDAGHRGAADEAERLFRAVLRTHPNDPVAWARLGELLFHYNPMRGRPLIESRLAFERSLELDPDDTEPLWHLAQLAAMEGRIATLDSLVERAGATPEAVTLRLIAAVLRQDTGAAARLHAQLRHASEEILYVSAAAVPLFTDDFREGARLAAILSSADRPIPWQTAGHILRAHTELAAGRPRAAATALREAARLDRNAALPYLAAFAALPFVQTAPAELRSLRDELERWNAETPATGAIQHPYVDMHDGVRPQLRHYLLGLLSARVGDTIAAERYATALEQRRDSGGTRRLSHDLALAIRAHGALDDHRLTDALDYLEATTLDPDAVVVSLSPFYSQAFERFTRAELLRLLDRPAEALQWYASVAESPPFGFIYRAPAELRQAEIHHLLGNIDEAAGHYARFLALWQDCEPELRPIIEEATYQYRTLQSDPSAD